MEKVVRHTLVSRSVFASLAFKVRVLALFTSFHVDGIEKVPVEHHGHDCEK